jgi:hypothetical protein
VDLQHIADVLQLEARVHRQAAADFGRNLETGHDAYDDALSQKFHEGASDAYAVVAKALENLLQRECSFDAALVDAQCRLIEV